MFEWSWSSGTIEQDVNAMNGGDTHSHGFPDFHWSRASAAAF